jgi:hypothetical protein
VVHAKGQRADSVLESRANSWMMMLMFT